MGIKLRQSSSGEELLGTVTGQVLVWNQETREWNPGAGSGGGVVASVSGTRTDAFPLTPFYTVPVAGLYRLSLAVCSMATEGEQEFDHIISFTPSDPLQYGGFSLNLTALPRVSAGFTETGTAYPSNFSDTALLPAGYVIRYESLSPASELFHFNFALELVSLFTP